MGIAESNITKTIMLKVSQMKGRLFRNNVGAVKTIDGRLMQFGLCKGSSDTIGFFPITITPQMVGATIAAFLAIECKTANGHPTPEQINFIDHVNQSGGIAFIARSPDECPLKIQQRIQELSLHE